MNFFEETKGKIKVAAQKAKMAKPLLTLAIGAVAATSLQSCQTPTRMNSWQTITTHEGNRTITTHNSQQWNLNDISRASRDFGRASEDFADAYYKILKARSKYR